MDSTACGSIRIHFKWRNKLVFGQCRVKLRGQILCEIVLDGEMRRGKFRSPCNDRHAQAVKVPLGDARALNVAANVRGMRVGLAVHAVRRAHALHGCLRVMRGA